MTADMERRLGTKEEPEVKGNQLKVQTIGTDYNFQRQIVWKNVIGFIYLHAAAIYGLYLAITSAKLLTNIWAFFILIASAQGVLMGAHRLYSHKSYKATWQLRLILVILQTIAGQNCMYVWVRDHRQHHKYSDTDADPHNARRGFFFSHMGWLMSKKHPKVIEKGKGIDMSDLEQDGIVMFQKKYYKTLYMLLAIAIPTMVPNYLWQEDIWVSLFVSYFCRYVVLLHGTWTVNSFAHMIGYRPYDQDIVPVDHIITAEVTLGEGWHNYHHAFPYDYRAAEFGYRRDSLTTQLIDLMAWVGWARDLRTASNDVVKRRIERKGDGTHPTAAAEPPATSPKRATFFLDILQDLDKFQSSDVGADTDGDSLVTMASEPMNGVAKVRAIDEMKLRNKIASHG
ncbi:acyl-CoA Delta-9 desaturase-like isoform X2 [Hetaerina americana]|uniref:acyl-CoA Delta-9 desaturase-like isoform X2 n=1 Tax=Hetaerina americana TaxID=62018 RepID=UPI003A7F1B30